MLWWQWRAKLNNVPERVLKHLHKIVRRLHTQPRDQWIALQIGCASAIWTASALGLGCASALGLAPQT